MLPYPPTPDLDLPDPLRAAVAAIRREPVPMESLRRCTERAKQLGTPQRPTRSLRLPRWSLVLGAVAASFLFGVLLRHMLPLATPDLADAASRPRGDLVVSLPPAPPTRPISMREIGNQWAEWERIRLPIGPDTASPPLRMAVRVRLEEQRATTAVELLFQPAPEAREFEYGLPPGATVQGVEPVPGANLLRGTVPPQGTQARFVYHQPLKVNNDRLQYSFPLPEQRLESFVFLLEADAATDRGAIFLPEDAVRRTIGDRVQYEIRFGPVRPSGAISYLPLVNPPK
jgi:hypothetical protein